MLITSISPDKLVKESTNILFDMEWRSQISESSDITFEDNHILYLNTYWSNTYFHYYYKQDTLLNGYFAQAIEPKISLDECLQEHLKQEDVDEWYCSNCKRHNIAIKKLDINMFPKILIIHLKRFVKHPIFEIWTKQQVPIVYPLNLSFSEKGEKYRLFGVTNHYGTLDYGHYTSFCKRADEWVYFDDEKWSCINELEKVQSENGYLLFYKLA